MDTCKGSVQKNWYGYVVTKTDTLRLYTVKNEQPYNTLGDWLKTARTKRGLSLRKLADIANVRHTTLHKIEQGGGIREDTLTLLVTALAESPEQVPVMLEEAKAASVGITLAPTTERDEVLNQLATLPPEKWEIIRALLLSWSEEPPKPS